MHLSFSPLVTNLIARWYANFHIKNYSSELSFVLLLWIEKANILTQNQKAICRSWYSTFIDFSHRILNSIFSDSDQQYVVDAVSVVYRMLLVSAVIMLTFTYDMKIIGRFKCVSILDSLLLLMLTFYILFFTVFLTSFHKNSKFLIDDNFVC